MAIPAKPKKSLEPAASLKATGASAAEAATAIQALDATANDIETPSSVRSQCVYLRDELLSMATPSAVAKRETVVGAAAAFASANV